MAVKPRLKGYGSSLGKFGGAGVNDYSVSSDIDDSLLGKLYSDINQEFNPFEKTVRDYVLASLGAPTVKVELTPFQLKIAIDEAITFISHHAPLWAKQYVAFETVVGQNVYELPPWIINNITYVAYKKSLLSIASQGGSLEFDYFIHYFNNNNLFSDFSVGEYLLLQQHIEQIRKILSEEGTWEIVNNRFLQIYPTPVTNAQDVIVEFRALDSATIHPAYRNWIQRYALAIARGMVGEVRSKYRTLPGPGGGAQLNGEDMLRRSASEKEALKEELMYEIEEPPMMSTF